MKMRKLVVFAIVFLLLATSISTALAAPKTVTILQPDLLKIANSYGYTVGWRSAKFYEGNKLPLTTARDGTLFLIALDPMTGMPVSFVPSKEWKNVQMISAPHSYIMSQQTYDSIMKWMKAHKRWRR
jgi:hypothetical protein